MKKTWNTPAITVYGGVENLTQQAKTIGKDDGVVLIIDGLTPPDGVAIGSI